MTVREFYDDLAPFYHLIYENWDASIARQGAALASVIGERWGDSTRTVLDAATGIGTQALGLAAHGYAVTASDIAPKAVRRATLEAEARGLTLQVHAADIRALAIQSRSMDIVLACDNALPHLLDEDEISTALAECLRCLRPNGGALFSIRDYGAAPPAGTIERRPYGAREWNGQRYQLEQVWHWNGPRYDLELRIIPDPPESGEATMLRTSYLALRPERLLELMTTAGFADATLDRGRFFQPLLFGTRP